MEECCGFEVEVQTYQIIIRSGLESEVRPAYINDYTKLTRIRSKLGIEESMRSKNRLTSCSRCGGQAPLNRPRL